MLRAERIAAPAVAPVAPPPGPPPLTHHEILRLAEPFSRAGHGVDMPASDRSARRLVFRARALAADGEAPALREQLLLYAGDAAWPQLQRQLLAADAAAASGSGGQASAPAGGLASLQAEGAAPAELLAWVQALPPARQWQQAGGVRVALGHKLQAPPRGQTEPVLTLLRASARVAGLAVVMTVSRVKNVPAELELRPDSGGHAAPVSLPEDLLAVLGLDWSRLSRHSGGWRASLRLRGDGSARGLDAEAKFRRSIEHLVQVLGAAPAAFHAQFRAARWRVALRRAFPLLVCLGLIGGAAAVPLLELGPGSVFRMLIFNAPPLLLVWLFAMRELPRIELPPLPRALPANAWAAAPPALAADAKNPLPGQPA